MTQKRQIYKCAICGNIVEVVHNGAGQLVCCGQPMQLQEPNTVDAAQEKHVPVIMQAGEGISVKVGTVPHPMEEAHFIEWIEVICADKIYRQNLKPGDKPEVVFTVSASDVLEVRAYCNLHGLWKA